MLDKVNKLFAKNRKNLQTIAEHCVAKLKNIHHLFHMRAFQTNSLAATGQLLQLTGVPYDKQALKDDLLSHPDYPSLFAVHHTLSKYGVENAPVEAGAEYLNELPQPFLAYMQLPGTGADFAVVSSVHNGSVTYINGKGRPETIKREEFLGKWKNVAVTVEKAPSPPRFVSSRTGTPLLKLIALQAVVTALLLLLVITTTALSASPALYAPWLLLKMAGLAVTALLLIYEVDRQNETVKQFCSATKTVNCDAVLQSSGARIGPFSWSEVGFTYFAGSFLYLLIAGSSPVAYFPLAILSLLTLPYTVYSLYYQYRVVKQWCRLCLAIQSIIVLESILVVGAWAGGNAYLQSITENWQSPVLLLGLLPLPLIAWLLLKPVLKRGTQMESYKYAYQRLLNDPEVFNAMLQRQKAAPAGCEACSLQIGNPTAQHEIIKVCNPYCGPCAKAHPLLEEIVKANPNVKLRVLFSGNNEEGDQKGKVAKHFINLNLQQGPAVAEKAMHYWYNMETKDRRALEEKYPAIEQPQTAAIKEAMNQWQDIAEITFTPTIYIDGYRLPETYKVADLKNILI